MKKLTNLLLMSLFFSISAQAPADDIEIYFQEGADSSAYVLLIMDASPNNFSQIFRNEAEAEAAMTPESFDQLRVFRSMEADRADRLGIDSTCGTGVGRWEIYRAVLATVLSEEDGDGNLKYGAIKIALASSNHSSTGGGNMLQGYERLDPVGLREIKKDLGAIPCDMTGADAHESEVVDTYLEWYAYLNGLPVVKGKDTEDNFLGLDPVDPDFDPNTMIDPDADDAVYDSPFDDPDECPLFYSIASTMEGTDEGQDFSIVDDVAHGWPDSIFSSAGRASKTEKVIRYMTQTNLVPSMGFPTPLQKGWVITDLLNSGGTRGNVGEMAEAGNTDPLDVGDPVALQASLENLFGEVLSVSSTFVAASVPVNVFNQTRSLDNLFIALFEARGNLAWPGNVKKLKLVDDPNDPDEIFDEIVDANGNRGFETTGSNKGRIFATALTFWTDPDALPPGTSDIDPNNPRFIPSGVDGRVVERGGSGQKIPAVVPASYGVPYSGFQIGDSNAASGATPRTVYLESESLSSPTTDDNLDDLSTAMQTNAVIQDLFGVTSSPPARQRDTEEWIQWTRGQDADGGSSDARFWLMADAIHSRPFALNYGDTDGDGTGYDPNNPDIKLLFGTGDGAFHMVENTDADGNETGTELFAFYPREMLAQIQRRRGAAAISEGREMRYGIDGAPVVLTVDAEDDGSLTTGGDDEVYVYFGLRRGGYSYYALDIIDPDAPRLQWKITQTRTDPTTTDFDELGLTFSTPYVGKVKYKNEATDVLVFGGGYHGGWDPNDPNDPAASEQIGKDINADDDAFGNAIYIVDARSGELIWKAVKGASTGATVSGDAVIYTHPDLVDSIPSDVTVLENTSGWIHRIYVGDTGGAVWRVDLPAANEDDADDTNDRADKWFISRLADLSPGGEDIRFFHAPDVVEAELEDGTPVDGVIIESGNRADPLDKRFAAADNYLYYLRDYNTISGTDPNDPTYTADDLADRTGCLGVFTEEVGTTCEPTNVNGWKIQFASSGEKGLSTPLVDAGRVFATTYIPGTPGVCGEPAEGRGRLYLVNLTDGSNVNNSYQRFYDLGPGIPSGAVLIGEVIWLPGGGISADIDGDGEIDNILTKSLTQRIIPIYWREPGIDKL